MSCQWQTFHNRCKKWLAFFYIPKRDHSPKCIFIYKNIYGEVHLIYQKHMGEFRLPIHGIKAMIGGFSVSLLISIIISVILSYTPLTQLQDFWASNIQVMMQFFFFWSCSLFNALILCNNSHLERTKIHQ